MILHNDNKDESKLFLHKVIDTGIDFKLQENFKQKNLGAAEIDKILVDLPHKGMAEEEILEDFKEHILPYSTNFSSTKFMGFPDAGNSVSAIGGAFLCDLMQQNLINQSFCAPAATFAEIAVIRWLRESVGYHNEAITDIWDVGSFFFNGMGNPSLSNCMGDLTLCGIGYPSLSNCIVPFLILFYCTLFK
jgi:L-2,4-diaminobutyrate decarboxylase